VNRLPDDGFFDEATPVHTARAPGRLDLMGGIADYSGSLVLQLPIAAEAEASVQWEPEAGGGAAPALGVGPTNPKAPRGASGVRLPRCDLGRPYGGVPAQVAPGTATHWGG
jgi:L-arabinokinase